MGTAKRLRTDDVAGGGTPAPLVDGRVNARNTGANYGTADVRAGAATTTILTPKGHGAGDEFVVEVWGREDSGDWAILGSSRALTHGTDWTAANLQADLRTILGSTSGITADGSDNSTLTITWGGFGKYGVRVVNCTGGMAVVVSNGSISYNEGSEQDGTPYSGTGAPSTNGRLFDVESSDHAGQTIPLGAGAISDDVTAGTPLLPPSVTSVVGNNGDGSLVITLVEDASAGGGGSGSILIAIYDLDAEEWVLTDVSDDAPAYTATGLDPADVVVVAWSQTDNGQLSRPSDPIYAAVT